MFFSLMLLCSTEGHARNALLHLRTTQDRNLYSEDIGHITIKIIVKSISTHPAFYYFSRKLDSPAPHFCRIQNNLQTFMIYRLLHEMDDYNKALIILH